MITQVALLEKDSSRGVTAYPTTAGAALRVCSLLCFVSWTHDGNFMYVHLSGTQSNE